MIELLVVLVLVGGLVGGPLLLVLAPWEITFYVGVTMLGVGLLIGLPASLYYHFRLWRALKPGRLWWLHPTGLHSQLSKDDRPVVMGWFRLGAVMFGVAVLGCFLCAAGMVRSP